MKSEWICWVNFPVPDDVKGILIKYSDGIFSDRYDPETGKRKYRPGKAIEGWKFMERRDSNQKCRQCEELTIMTYEVDEFGNPVPRWMKGNKK